MTALHGLAKSNYGDPHAAYGGLWNYNTTTGNRFIAHTMVHTKGVAHPAAFRPFEAVRPQLLDTMRTTTVGELTEEASGFMPSGWCDLGATVTYQNRLDVMRAVHKITDEVFGTVSPISNLGGLSMILTIFCRCLTSRT